MQKLRKVIQIALKYGYIEKDPFLFYAIKKKKTNIQPLTNDELRRIEEREFNISRLSIIKDMFIFTCYTGLAFGDAATLTKQNIGLGIDGEEWLFVNRGKTGNLSRIPLLPPAKKILDKYQNHPKVISMGVLLPIPSNQKFNSYLKEIADLCKVLNTPYS